VNLATALAPFFVQQNTSTPTTIGTGFGLFSGVTQTATPVTANTALTLSAFYNGIEIITNDYAKLPKAVFRKTDNGRFKQSSHPVNYLISKRPNNLMTAFNFDKMMLQYAVLKGNAYAQIVRNNTGTPVSLQLINQDQHPVEVVEYNAKLFYKVDGTVIAAEDMLHIPGFSFNGITGVSVITHAANSLGINLSAKEFAIDYYDQKGVGTGVVTAATKMDNDAKTRLGEALANAFSTKKNWQIPIIDEASKFQHIKITPQESQFLLTNKDGLGEVARFLNIPLHKLKSLDNVNNSITENLEIQHGQDSILPWVRKFEQEYDAKLFNAREIKQNYYTKVNINALLRADTKTKTDYLTKGIFSGWLTRNEARALEEMNPLEGLDEPLTPVNTQTQEQIESKISADEK